MDEMLRTMPVSRFSEWMAYAELEPFDEVRDDLRAASIVQAITNMLSARGSRRMTLEDCVLKFGGEEVRAQRKDWRHMKMIAMMFAAQSKEP